jgi:ElaB/YqjD/DUF883 family membrane-anchored ribosome-binding protein
LGCCAKADKQGLLAQGHTQVHSQQQHAAFPSHHCDLLLIHFKGTTMSNYNPSDAAHNLLDRAAASADQALDGLSQQAHHMQDEAQHLGQRGVKALRESTQQLRDSAHRASDETLHYVKAEPVKALLIAAATGAALVALIGLMSRSRH